MDDMNEPDLPTQAQTVVKGMRLNIVLTIAKGTDIGAVAPKFDLESYISNYTGECVAVQSEAAVN